MVRMLDMMRGPADEYTGFPDVKSLLEDRIGAAVLRREKITGTDAKRLVFSESDRLPGLIADLYRDTLVVQCTTLGMENLKESAVEILDRIIGPRVIYEKSLSPLRAKEGLSPREGTLKGTPEPVTITENGLKFLVDPVKGSKTGFYLDQRDNRRRLGKYAGGKSVLDAFCYTGSFTAFALHFGAREVLGIEESRTAVESARGNMELNGLKNAVFEAADVFSSMKAMARGGRLFDLIILDPPPFSRSREEHERAMRGYRELHNLALRLLPENGVLFTFSCSQNVSMAELIASVKGAARASKCRVQVLEQMFQSTDHHYSTLVPESFYLKGAVFRKTPV
jgi:23S rRNA (cytosine1962-C5)-methyltransferase